MYRSCILSIILYNFQIWYYNKVLLLYLLKGLRNIQRRVALWILGAFCTFPSTSIKVIAGLIPIYLYLQKLNDRFHLRAHTLLINYVIKLLLKTRHMNDKKVHWLLLKRLISRSQEVDFVSFYFLSHFYLCFNLFFIFLFLELWG